MILVTNEKAMFVFNKIIADKSLDKQKQYLLELPISGIHFINYL